MCRNIRTIAVVVAVVAFAHLQVAEAHRCPATATKNGIGISFTAFFNDGVTPVVGTDITPCETIKYEMTLSWAGGLNGAFSGGQVLIVTPDGLTNDITPAEGIRTNGPVECSATDFQTFAQVPYTVSPADFDPGTSNVTAVALYRDGISHLEIHQMINADLDLTLPVAPCVELFCAAVTCDPEVVHGEFNERLGACTTNDISNAQCPDNEFCATVVCNEETDTCDTTDISTSQCPDNEFCATIVCNEEVDRCVTTDISTEQCPDICTECDEGTDGCVTADPLPPECEVAICRTPGFWGTHAGTDKNGSRNITQAVIDAAGGCLQICGEIITSTGVQDAESALEAICVSPKGDSKQQLVRQLTAAALNCIISGGGSDCTGISIESLFQDCNTACEEGDGEMIGPCIELIDCFNNGGHPVLDGESVVCEDVPDELNCHLRPLVNEELGLNFEPPGPAGSAKGCNKARKNKCTVSGPGEAECETGTQDETAESCE